MSPYEGRHGETNGSGENVKLRDAVTAANEETELEAVVSVVGEGRAQRAVSEHVLPLLVANLNRRAD